MDDVTKCWACQDRIRMSNLVETNNRAIPICIDCWKSQTVKERVELMVTIRNSTSPIRLPEEVKELIRVVINVAEHGQSSSDGFPLTGNN